MREFAQIVIERDDRIDAYVNSNGEVALKVNGESILYVPADRVRELVRVMLAAQKKTTAATVA